CFRSFFFFFFQAEDGIRDRYVTRVQTCALPISPWRPRSGPAASLRHPFGRAGPAPGSVGAPTIGPPPPPGPVPPPDPSWPTDPRSEERRVGKEWRARRGPRQCKKKKRS